MESFYKNSEIELREFAAKEKLEIVNFRFGADQIFCPPDPSPPQAGEDRIPFELYSEYTARNQNPNSRQKTGRYEVPTNESPARRIQNPQGFPRSAWLKKYGSSRAVHGEGRIPLCPSVTLAKEGSSYFKNTPPEKNMPHIKLRQQRVSDAQRFFEILKNPHFRYFTVIVNTINDELKFLRRNPKWRRENFAHNFAILMGNTIIGGCGIRINQHRKYIGEIGYFVDEKYWGKGIATTAVRMLEKIGFQKLKLTRIEIIMDPRNKASQKVAIKNNYKKEGLLKKVISCQKCRAAIHYHDAYLYAKVR